MSSINTRRKNLLVTGEPTENHANVLVAGEINSHTCERLEGELRSLLDRGCTSLALNFEQVTLITSAGLRILLVLSRELNRHGGRLVLYSVPEAVSDIFNMTGFDTILSVGDSYESAMALVDEVLETGDNDSARQTGHPNLQLVTIS